MNYIFNKLTYNTLIVFVLSTMLTANLFAQDGTLVDPTNSQVRNNSAALEVYSTTQGFLAPRVSLTQTTSSSPVTSPALGLMVFNTNAVNDVTVGYYYWNGSSWQRLINGNGSFPTGSGTLNYVTKWTPNGTSLGNSQIFDNGANVGIGTNAPTNTLHLYRNGSTPSLQLYSDRSAGSTSPAQLMENRILFGGVNNQGWSTPNGAGIDFHTNYPAETSTGRLNFWAYPSSSASPNLTVWNGNVGIGTTSPTQKLDVIGNVNAAHLLQGPLVAHPKATWSVGSTSTGAVIIKLPGTIANYGMLHMEIDVYEYGTTGATTYIIGGHNWNGQWYNYSCQTIGSSTKKVRLAVKDNQYAIVIGETGSSWSYGHVVLSKITDGGYYSGIMDLGGTYTVYQDNAAESYTWITADINSATNPALTTNYIQNQVAADQPAGFRINGNGLFNGGSVGIGTTSPADKLHVNGGNIKLNGTAGEAPYTLIGYSSGTSLWEISGNATTAKTVIATAHDWDRQISFIYTPGTVGAAGGNLQIGQLDKNNTNWTHGITQFYTNGTERMRIIADGNVGIGTTVPNAKLHVEAGRIFSSKTTFPNPGSYTNADLVLGSNSDTREGYTGTNGSHIFLRSSAKSSITALDESNNLGQISYENLVWTIGENIGWGAQGIRLPALGAGYVKSNASGNLSSSAIAAGDLPALAGDVSGAYNANVVADDSHNHTELESKPQYNWNAATAPNSYPDAVAASFVSASEGFPSYGSVLHVRTYPNDGGALQLYAPYNATYGGNSLRYRLGLYNNAGWTGWKTIWDDTNDGAGSGMDADLLDGQNSSFYGPDNLGNHTATTTLNMNGNIINNYAKLEPYGIGSNSGQGTHAYAIYQEGGAWTGPYPDLRIAFHTGIKFGANSGYEGMRFYTDYDMSSLVMSVNDGSTGGASNVYMAGSLGIGAAPPATKLHVAGGGAIIGTTSSGSNNRTLTILNNGQSQISFGAYPWEWAPAFQLQNNDNTKFVWLSAGGSGSYSGYDPRLMIAGGGLDIYTNATSSTNGQYIGRFVANGSVGTLNMGSMNDPAGDQGLNNWITWGYRSDNNPYYNIRTNYKTYGSYTYSRLQLNWHTGIEIGAHSQYGGTRFFSDAPGIGGSQIMSVGDGDANIRITNNLYVGTYGGINSAPTSYGSLGLLNAKGGYYGLLMGQGTANPNLMWDGAGNGGVYFENYGWMYYYLVGTRHLNINTSSDLGATLGVNGNIVCTTIRSNGFIEPSDERLKSNITPISGALNKVKQIQGVTYNWNKELDKNKDLDEGTQYGVIAQELEKILPELVTTDENDENCWKAVNYSHLVPVLIEALKEQQTEIETQKATITAQQKTISGSVDDISFLKQYTKELEAKINTIAADQTATGSK